jgi:uncharacterized protein (TIGR03032 family)
MAKPLPPFSCTYAPNVPGLLRDLNCTVAISTYQAGKVIFISATDADRLIQLPRNFSKPMGLAIDGNKFAIATKDEVVIFSNAERMAKNFPVQPNTYDALFLPRATYYTGETDIHDLVFAGEKLWAVSAVFSCLSQIDDAFSIQPKWSPFFVDGIQPNDQCHMNGVCFENNNPAYVTALGKSNTSGGWRDRKLQGGILITVSDNKILSENLAMPHSPRLYDDRLYILLSATGELAEVNRSTGKLTVLKTFPGFVRGMDRVDDYLFVGLSKLRTTSSSFRDLPIAKSSLMAGVIILHLPTMTQVGHIQYETSVEEIYDVKILQKTSRPGIVSTEKGEHKLAITTPSVDFWAIQPKEKE